MGSEHPLAKVSKRPSFSRTLSYLKLARIILLLLYPGLHNSKSLKGQIININLQRAAKVHFDVENSL